MTFSQVVAAVFPRGPPNSSTGFLLAGWDEDTQHVQLGHGHLTLSLNHIYSAKFSRV